MFIKELSIRKVFFKTFTLKLFRLEIDFRVKVLYGKPLTTKLCNFCGNDKLSLFPSQNLKRCPDCDVTMNWVKDDKQKGYY